MVDVDLVRLGAARRGSWMLCRGGVQFTAVRRTGTPKEGQQDADDIRLVRSTCTMYFDSSLFGVLEWG